MEKLTGIQIGRLAEHVEAVLKEYPEDEEIGTHEEKEEKGSSEIEKYDWEVELDKRIDADHLLPSADYVNGTEEDILDFLIGYFS